MMIFVRRNHRFHRQHPKSSAGVQKLTFFSHYGARESREFHVAHKTRRIVTQARKSLASALDEVWHERKP
jgi:hypothetical protein